MLHFPLNQRFEFAIFCVQNNFTPHLRQVLVESQSVVRLYDLSLFLLLCVWLCTVLILQVGAFLSCCKSLILSIILVSRTYWL